MQGILKRDMHSMEGMEFDLGREDIILTYSAILLFRPDGVLLSRQSLHSPLEKDVGKRGHFIL